MVNSPFVLKILPLAARRYQVTNRRLLIGRFGSNKPIQEIALADIQDVRPEAKSFNAYFRAANLEVARRRGVQSDAGVERRGINRYHGCLGARYVEDVLSQPA